MADLRITIPRKRLEGIARYLGSQDQDVCPPDTACHRDENPYFLPANFDNACANCHMRWLLGRDG